MPVACLLVCPSPVTSQISVPLTTSSLGPGTVDEGLRRPGHGVSVPSPDVTPVTWDWKRDHGEIGDVSEDGKGSYVPTTPTVSILVPPPFRPD